MTKSSKPFWLSSGKRFGKCTFPFMLYDGSFEHLHFRRIANTFSVSSIALLLYDYLINLPSEVRCIWKRKLSAATVLYLINRYGILIYKGVTATIQMWSFPSATETQADDVCISLPSMTKSMALRFFCLMVRC